MRAIAQVFCLAMMLDLASSPSAVAAPQPGAGEAVSQSSDGPQSRLSNRLNRRSVCNNQARERGLSGRMARRFTRLCLSGLPVPKPIRQAP